MVSTPFEGRKLELAFPCPWSYTVFGTEERLVRAAVASILPDQAYSLRFSHTSRGGKYCSMHLEIIAESDEQRLGVFHELREHPDVRYVL